MTQFPSNGDFLLQLRYTVCFTTFVPLKQTVCQQYQPQTTVDWESGELP